MKLKMFMEMNRFKQIVLRYCDYGTMNCKKLVYNARLQWKYIYCGFLHRNYDLGAENLQQMSSLKLPMFMKKQILNKQKIVLVQLLAVQYWERWMIMHGFCSNGCLKRNLLPPPPHPTIYSFALLERIVYKIWNQ